MNPLAIFALATFAFICFFAGITLALLSFAAYLLYRAATTALDHTQNSEKNLVAILSRNQLAVEKLESSVTSALTRVDASAMHEASLLIQRTQRQFARTTDQFMKLLYSQEGAAAIAVEEARESQEAAQDQAYSGIDPNAYLNHLKQRKVEQEAAQVLATALHQPPPDPDDAWRMQEEEERMYADGREGGEGEVG